MLFRMALTSTILAGFVSNLRADVIIEVQKPGKTPLVAANVIIETVPGRDAIEDGKTDRDGIYKAGKLPGEHAKVYVTVIPRGEDGKGLEPVSKECSLRNVR